MSLNLAPPVVLVPPCGDTHGTPVLLETSLSFVNANKKNTYAHIYVCVCVIKHSCLTKPFPKQSYLWDKDIKVRTALGLQIPIIQFWGLPV